MLKQINPEQHKEFYQECDKLLALGASEIGINEYIHMIGPYDVKHLKQCFSWVHGKNHVKSMEDYGVH